MFFTPDLLAKRDSGFGLLWLAATLGSKSTFKKLPRRSVLTADIGELCGLISEPVEPLALRLSSNLMVGVARVYKVKQEMFLTDVAHCATSLKKIVEELHHTAIPDGQLQMAQPTLRNSALNVTTDPANTFVMDFDALVADWDDFLSIDRDHPSDIEDDYDETYGTRVKRKDKRVSKTSTTLSEEARANLHILKEDYESFLADSFDIFADGRGLDLSSSQATAGILDLSHDNLEDLDLGVFGDELAKELGEGWGVSAFDAVQGYDGQPDFGTLDNEDFNVNFNFNMDGDMDMPPVEIDPGREGAGTLIPVSTPSTPQGRKKRSIHDNKKENDLPSALRKRMPQSEGILSPTASFSRIFLSQDADGDMYQPLADLTPGNQQKERPAKKKTTRLLLDARTQLTDEELKEARSQYVKGQEAIRRELEVKRMEKESEELVDHILFGAPSGVYAPALVDFWKENLRVQVDARSGKIELHEPLEPVRKRRRLQEPQGQGRPESSPNAEIFTNDVMDFEIPLNDYPIPGFHADFEPELDRRHSSEEPGHARRVSRQSSVLGGQFERAPGSQQDSQKSLVFPWDHAGPSSSNDAFSNASGSDRTSLGMNDVPYSRKSSVSVDSPFRGISVQGRPDSPATIGNMGSIVGEDFVFDVNNADSQDAFGMQQSDINYPALERNSLNFLKYAKMQYQSLPNGVDLTFDNIVPQHASSRRIAASAFYHCLVLTTKDVLSVQQNSAYGPLTLHFNDLL